MRVVLRQPETGLYLQPSGDWAPERETAREFLSAVVAYWWAVEQKLAAEVWFALRDSSKDFACAKVLPRERRPTVNGDHEDWSAILHSFLYNGIEVDLINFDFDKHAQPCALIAEAFAIEFRLDRDLQSRVAHFRRKPPALPPWR